MVRHAKFAAMQTLRGTLLRPRSVVDCQVTPGAMLRIGDDGRIAEIGAQAPGVRDEIGDEGCWILPGFIDAHLHLPQWDRRGIDGLSLFEWQQKIGFPAEERFQDPATAQRLAEDFVTGVIANGTTTVAAFGSSFAQEIDSSFAIFARRGLRAIYGMTLHDVDTPKPLRQVADEALDASRNLAAKWHGAENGRLRYAFSPRASIRCSERLMRGAAALAEMLKCHVQTHIAESLEELTVVREKFPEQVDEVDLFLEFGLFTRRSLMAHGIFLGHEQLRRVADRGAALIHCPTANLFRESGLMDYVGHRADGIRLALGSSVAGGFEPFMPRVAVEALQTVKAIKVRSMPRSPTQTPAPAEAWWLLTAGAADALGMADRVGSLEIGYDADCLVVRPQKWTAELPPQQQISALLYTISPRQIEHVFIAGRRVGP